MSKSDHVLDIFSFLGDQIEMIFISGFFEIVSELGGNICYFQMHNHYLETQDGCGGAFSRFLNIQNCELADHGSCDVIRQLNG